MGNYFSGKNEKIEKGDRYNFYSSFLLLFLI